MKGSRGHVLGSGKKFAVYVCGQGNGLIMTTFGTFQWIHKKWRWIVDNRITFHPIKARAR